MSAIVTLGEILVEIMRPSAGQPLDRVGAFRGPFASGAPAIFAIAAARLGLSTAFIGTTGEDAFGRLLRSRLAEEGIDIRGLRAVPDYGTGVAFVAYDDTGEREFVFHIRHAAAGQLHVGALSQSLFDGIRWLHISGSTLALNDESRAACLQALNWAQAAGGKLSLDPNLRPELMPADAFREALAPYLAAADLVLPTAGEARALTGQSDDTCAAQALAIKPGALVALKRGPAGCAIYDGARCIAVPGFAVQERDPTGAGDCFAAGFIAGLEAGWPLDRVGRFANAAGALAVTRFGPAEGAATFAQAARFAAEEKPRRQRG